MDIKQAIKERHSVRQYLNKPIEQEKRDVLNKIVSDVNAESGLGIYIVYDDNEGFNSKMAHYGKFTNVNNYIVLAGHKDMNFDEKCGYYGEKIVLEAQKIGLNTCWVALTYNKKVVRKCLDENLELCMVIALGYGETSGISHKGKSLSQVTDTLDGKPEWFIDGVEAALLAPTAVNQQKFKFTMQDGEATAKVSGMGAYTKTDLGIVKYHFDVASGKTCK